MRPVPAGRTLIIAIGCVVAAAIRRRIDATEGQRYLDGTGPGSLDVMVVWTCDGTRPAG